MSKRKYPDGPHQRAGRRCRRGKAVALIVVIAALAVLSSWTTCAAPEPGKWANPTIQDLVTARNEYNLAGGPYGNAKILYERYPQYAAYITGEVDTPEECEAVG